MLQGERFDSKRERETNRGKEVEWFNTGIQMREGRTVLELAFEGMKRSF